MSSKISEEPRQHPVTGEATTFGRGSVHDPETASSINRSEVASFSFHSKCKELTLERKSDEEEWGDQKDSSTYNLPKPGPSDDHFKVLLEPLLDRDTKQCNAWKDEVQNILIFAGLFSAVVTAFVLASYQKLQPDPNDQIIALLSRIADQMNTPTGNVSSSATSTPTSSVFIPASSDIRINSFWFISLVLSLTVALIGIITLQWLCEHQRYESGIASSKIFAIFNTRSDGLKRWYVPQIFAALPLLLQASLVLFFAGLVEFLFAIRIEVAIPVIVAVAIPILFLVVTTILPTLQLYAIQFPHLLSMNYSAPAPCPYKSPQALVFQRAAVISESLFRLFGQAIAVLWFPFVSIARVFSKSNKPFYGSSAPFSKNYYLMGYFHARLRKAAGNWMSMDMEWLGTRTIYALVIHQPPGSDSLAWPYGNGYDKLTDIIGFYDSVDGVKSIASSSALTSDTYRSALTICMRTVVFDMSTAWKDLFHDWHSRELLQAHITGLVHIIGHYGHPQTEKLVELSRGDIDAVSNAFLAVLMDQALGGIRSVLDFQHPITRERLETHMKLTRLYLSRNADELFLCSRRPGITPTLTRWFWAPHSATQVRIYLERYHPSWKKYMSRRWTRTLKNVIVDARKMIPVQDGRLYCIGSFPAQCGNNLHSEPILELTRYVLLFQISEDIRDTLRLLHDICESKTHPFEDQPFVLIIACTYIDAVARANQHKVVDREFGTLLDAICSSNPSLSPELNGAYMDGGEHWDSLMDALVWIREDQAAKQRERNAQITISVASIRDTD